MLFSIPMLVLTLAAVGAAQHDFISPPFNLYVLSSNKTINGSTLAACHSGAAQEVFCLGAVPSPSKPNPLPATSFWFNTSDANQTAGTYGLITYWLRGGNFNLSQSLSLSYNKASNIAVPVLGFHEGYTDDEVVFDESDLLAYTSYVDDTKGTGQQWGSTQKYHRWYACSTYTGSYNYVTLAWLLGNKRPQNPSCVKVDIKRVWVTNGTVSAARM